MFIRRTSLGQAGDTIVEVLISIAVVSLILGGAYVTTNRSLLATRSAEEQGNAFKLVESQLELIRAMIATPGGSQTLTTAPASFCITSTTTVAASASAACKMNASGSPSTTEPVFNLAITKSGDVFTVRNTWAAVDGKGNDSVQMTYRVYP